jgi:hypothetical protein
MKQPQILNYAPGQNNFNGFAMMNDKRKNDFMTPANELYSNNLIYSSTGKHLNPFASSTIFDYSKMFLGDYAYEKCDWRKDNSSPFRISPNM